MKLSEITNLYNLYNQEQILYKDPLKNKEDRDIFLKAHHIALDSYQELEMDSHFADAHQDISYTKDIVSLHSHMFFELLYCRSGKIEYFLGTKRYRVTPGDIIIIPPGISHRPLFPEYLEEPYRRYVIWISAEMMSFFQKQCPELSSIVSSPTFIHTKDTSFAYLKDYFSRACFENIEHSLGWEISILGITSELIPLLARAKNSVLTPAPLPEKPELIDEILYYIENNMTKKIVLSDVAKQFFVSESTISQLFRKKLDVSFYHCVTQRRLIAAKNCILQGDSLDSIYEKVGFGDYSTFFRAFKKEYGISPSKYKNLYTV